MNELLLKKYINTFKATCDFRYDLGDGNYHIDYRRAEDIFEELVQFSKSKEDQELQLKIAEELFQEEEKDYFYIFMFSAFFYERNEQVFSTPSNPFMKLVYDHNLEEDFLGSGHTRRFFTDVDEKRCIVKREKMMVCICCYLFLKDEERFIEFITNPFDNNTKRCWDPHRLTILFKHENDSKFPNVKEVTNKLCQLFPYLEKSYRKEPSTPSTTSSTLTTESSSIPSTLTSSTSTSSTTTTVESTNSSSVSNQECAP